MYFYILWDTCKLAFQLSVFTTLNKVLNCIVLYCIVLYCIYNSQVVNRGNLKLVTVVLDFLADV